MSNSSPLDRWFYEYRIIDNKVMRVIHGVYAMEGPWPDDDPMERKETLVVFLNALLDYKIITNSYYVSELEHSRSGYKIRLTCDEDAVRVCVYRDAEEAFL